MNFIRISSVFLLLVATCWAQTDKDQQNVQQNQLKLHNQKRALHGTGDMTLDDTLNKNAITCARHYAKLGKIDHSCEHKDGAGENLAWTSSGRRANYIKTSERSVKMWYDEEIGDYNYDSPGDSGPGQTGHFTQMVWKSSDKLGAGVAQNSSTNAIYVTCLYSPHGNIQRWGNDDSKYDYYKENVPRPK